MHLSGYGEDPVTAGLNAAANTIGIANSLEEIQARREDRPRQRELLNLQLQGEREAAAQWIAEKPVREANQAFQLQVIKKKTQDMYSHDTAQTIESAVNTYKSGDELTPDQSRAVFTGYLGIHPNVQSLEDIESMNKEVETLNNGIHQLGPVLKQVISDPKFKGGTIERGQKVADMNTDDFFNAMGQAYDFKRAFPGAKSVTVNRLILTPDPSGRFKAMVTPEMMVVDKEGNAKPEPLVMNGKVVALPAEMFVRDIEGKKVMADAMTNVLINTAPEDIAGKLKQAQHDKQQSQIKLAAETSVHGVQLKNHNAAPAELENEYKRVYLEQAEKAGFTPTEADMKLLDADAKSYAAKANNVQHWHLGTVGGKRFGSKQGVMLNEESGEVRPVGGEYAEFANETKPEGDKAAKAPKVEEIPQGMGMFQKMSYNEKTGNFDIPVGKPYAKGKDAEETEKKAAETPEERKADQEEKVSDWIEKQSHWYGKKNRDDYFKAHPNEKDLSKKSAGRSLTEKGQGKISEATREEAAAYLRKNGKPVTDANIKYVLDKMKE